MRIHSELVSAESEVVQKAVNKEDLLSPRYAITLHVLDLLPGMRANAAGRFFSR